MSSRTKKLQYLLISELQKEGYVNLVLPGGMVVEFGIVQEDKKGNLIKAEDYCWVIATQKNREISMDSYNLRLQLEENTDKILLDEDVITEDGNKVKVVTAV